MRKKLILNLIVVIVLFTYNLFSDCRLLIVSSKFNYTLNESSNSILLDIILNELQNQGGSQNSFPNNNDDGWGLVSYVKGNTQTYGVYRGSEPAYNSSNYNNAKSAILATNNLHLVIGHVRKASSGVISVEDPHPFIMNLFGNDYSFAHNGSVNKDSLRNLIESHDDTLPEPWLDTHPPHTYGGSGDWHDTNSQAWHNIVDSELYFLWIMLNVKLENGNVLEALRNSLSLMGDLGSENRNFVFTDGTDIYAYRNSSSESKSIDHYLKYCYNDQRQCWVVMSTMTDSIIYKKDIPNDGLLYLSTARNAVLFKNFSAGSMSLVKVLHSGWNWEGFPILASDNVSGPATLNYLINYGISEVKNKNWTNTSYLYSNGNWIPDPNFYFNRITFYKIQISDDTPQYYEDNNYIVQGQIRDASLPLIENIQKNTVYWLDYNILPSQNIKDAFGSFWDIVKKVKSEDWYYDWGIEEYKDGSVPAAPGWETKGKTMIFGKGYEVVFSEDVTGANFTWHYPNVQLLTTKEKKEPKTFTYHEKSDYEAIDIMSVEDISKDAIMEIGVFQDGECVGASVVDEFPVQILAYTSSSGGSLNFQVSLYDKSCKKINNLMIYDEKERKFISGKFLPRKREHSVIKLNVGDYEYHNSETPQVISQITVYPNPFNPKTTIEYTLSNGEFTDISIFNLKGELVKRLVHGYQEKGNYKVVWNGKNKNNKTLSSGIYFYKIKVENQEKTGKLILLK